MDNYSVLMSVYYKEKPEFLFESIDSMLKQTFTCNQFIIVKDGPIGDELNTVIDKFDSSNRGLFTVISLEKNSGLGRALDIGMKYSLNELIARMDSDDISMKSRCYEEVKLFESDPSLDIVGAYINEFYDDSSNVVSSRQVPVEHKDIVKFARRRSPFNHPTVMYKKTSVIRCGGYGSYMRKEDLRLFPTMVNNGCKAHNIPKVLLLFRSNADNYKRRKTWINCKEYIRVIYENYRSGFCTFGDYLYVLCTQTAIYLMPTKLMIWVSNHMLRKSAIIGKDE